MNKSYQATAHKFVLASGIVILTLGIIQTTLLYWEYNNIKTEMQLKILGTLIALYILKWELGPPYLLLVMGMVCFIPLFNQRKLFIN